MKSGSFLKVNARSLVIAAAIGIGILSAIVFVFFEELVRMSAPALYAPAGARAAAEKVPAPYSMPPNNAQAVAEARDNAGREKEAREAAAKMRAETRAECADKREEAMAELLAAEKGATAQAEPQQAPPTRSVVVPTREDREKMRSQGITAY